MVHYYSQAVGGSGSESQQRDTWSAKRSLRSYLINEARHARGLTGLNQDEVSDFDDDLWESDDDIEDASSTSDQWDADDEIDHEEDNDDEDDDDDEDDEQADRAFDRRHVPAAHNNETDKEYETENDELDGRHRESEKESTDNQSYGSTYVDRSFIFVAPDEASQSASWHAYTPHSASMTLGSERPSKSETNRLSLVSHSKAFQVDHPHSPAACSPNTTVSDSPPPVPSDKLRPVSYTHLTLPTTPYV